MSDITDDFKGIPIETLIGAPLKASCESQKMLAQSMIDFIDQIGFDEGKTRTVQFDLERPVTTETGVTKESVSVEAPLLGLVPIPALLIDTVNIDFSMEVTSVEASKETKDKSRTVDGSLGKWGGAKMSGKVSTQRERTRQTDKTAKYEFRVEATQQPPTEGMSKLMDLFASVVEPITTS